MTHLHVNLDIAVIKLVVIGFCYYARLDLVLNHVVNYESPSMIYVQTSEMC